MSLVQVKTDNILVSPHYIAERTFTVDHGMFPRRRETWNVYDLGQVAIPGANAYVWDSQTRDDAVAVMDALEAQRIIGYADSKDGTL